MPRILLLAAVAAALLPAVSAGQASLPADQLKKVKAATVFIKVRTPAGAATGSGFVAKADGPNLYVVTNHHVIDAPDPARGGMPGPAVEVVFDSGTPTERVVKAAVAAADPQADLAVLKVTGVKDPPAPLDVTDPPPLMETMPVFVCGFPFGGRLAVGEKNPEISIGQASVSSIRKNPLGLVAAIELTGALNPGNSGGPVVSDKGKLVGVAVTTVRGAGLGRAIPQQEVAFMLRGRVGPVRLVPAGVGKARLEVAVIDPLRRVTSAVAHYKPAGGEVPKMTADKLMIIPGATKLPLKLDPEAMTATAELALPDPKKAELLVQIEMIVPNGTLLTTPGPVTLSDPRAAAVPGATGSRPLIRLPSGHMLPLPSFRRPPGSEDDTLSDLIRKPEGFVGKAVEFDALTSCTVLPQGDRFELAIETDAERPPTNLRPVVPKDLALQLSDLGAFDPYKFTVRLKGRVQKPAGRDDRHLIEVTEVGFLNDAGAVETTLKPEAGPPAGKPSLSTLNRFPEKYVGQVVTVDGVVKAARFAGKGLGVDVANENEAPPLNLEFYAPKDLHNLLANEVPGGGAAAKLTVTVDRVDAKTGRGLVGVTKVELVGVGPKPKAFASTEPVAYPGSVPPAAAKPTTPVADKPAPVVAAARAPEPAAGNGGDTTTYVLIGVGLAVVLGGVVVVALVLRRKGAAPPRYGPKKVVAEPPARPRAAKPAARPAANGRPRDEFPGFDFEKKG